MISKHKKAITVLVDTTEAVLDVLEKNKIDPDKIAQGPEFKVLVHLLKMIIDQQVGIPNELGEKINALSEHLDIDEAIQKTVH